MKIIEVAKQTEALTFGDLQPGDAFVFIGDHLQVGAALSLKLKASYPAFIVLSDGMLCDDSCHLNLRVEKVSATIHVEVDKC